jgi:hypothetical protein
VGINLVDHIIVGNGRYASFMDRMGMLENKERKKHPSSLFRWYLSRIVIEIHPIKTWDVSIAHKKCTTCNYFLVKVYGPSEQVVEPQPLHPGCPWFPQLG